MYHLLQAGALGERLVMVFGVRGLLKGAGLLWVPRAEQPQCPGPHPALLNLHCATRSREGLEWGALVHSTCRQVARCGRRVTLTNLKRWPAVRAL